MKSIAIDFGGTLIKIALIDSGHILAMRTICAHSERGLAPRLPEVARIASEMCADTVLDGVGIALPGIVDIKRKVLLSIHGKYEDALHMDMAGWGASTFGLSEAKIYVDMDAYAALQGEIHYGCGKGETDAVMMIIGTGVGTAAMINGHLIRGRHYQACLGGHFIVDSDNHPCTCGGMGCLEANASGWAIDGIARERPGFTQSSLAKLDLVTFKDIDEQVALGDPFSIALLEDCISFWSAGVLGLVHAFDPELVILSGGVMNSTERIFRPLEQQVVGRAWTPWGKVRVVCASDPDSSVCLGLHSLVERGSRL